MSAHSGTDRVEKMNFGFKLLANIGGENPTFIYAVSFQICWLEYGMILVLSVKYSWSLVKTALL